VFLIVPLIVSLPLLDPDEGLHAAIAQEMVIHHDYVTPTFLGEPFLDKPILFFWTEALSLRVFGMREIAVRIPPLVFGLLGMLAVATLARTLFDEQRALIAGIVYASMLLPLGVSQVAVHDVALVPFLCGAALCLFHAARSPHAARWGIAIGLCLGLSILTKGLVGVVFTGIFGLCLAAADRRSFRRRSRSGSRSPPLSRRRGTSRWSVRIRDTSTTTSSSATCGRISRQRSRTRDARGGITLRSSLAARCRGRVFSSPRFAPHGAIAAGRSRCC
jgi:4-amino-4-deoxy-L-arabinose transferase-like glycosyltransferase